MSEIQLASEQDVLVCKQYMQSTAAHLCRLSNGFQLRYNGRLSPFDPLRAATISLSLHSDATHTINLVWSVGVCICAETMHGVHAPNAVC